jgi:hypothetical protein
MSQSLILTDALFPLDGGRKREGKKMREKLPWGRRVFPGLDPPCWVCHRLKLLSAIKD